MPVHVLRGSLYFAYGSKQAVGSQLGSVGLKLPVDTSTGPVKIDDPLDMAAAIVIEIDNGSGHPSPGANDVSIAGARVAIVRNSMAGGNDKENLYLDIAAPPSPDPDDFEHQRAVLNNIFRGAAGIFQFLCTFSPQTDDI